jgi:hypothetical protein
MNYRKHGLKALGLCFLVAIGMMAVTAVSAQAAEWLELVGGVSKKIESDLPFIGEKDSAHWLLHSDVAGVKILILCSTLAVSQAVLKGDGTALAHLAFTICDTFLEGSEKASAECDVINEPILALVKILQFLHNGRDYLYFSPHNGKGETEVFTTIKLKAGCAIGESFNVKGHAVVEDCENKFREHLVRHLIQMNQSASLFPAPHVNDLRFGTKPAVILGSEWIKLESGNAWSGNAL